MQFSDLIFAPHAYPNARHAIATFENGYGLSVVDFPFSEGYECGIVRIERGRIGLCYNNLISEDAIVCYCDEDKVTSLLEQVEKLNHAKTLLSVSYQG